MTIERSLVMEALEWMILIIGLGPATFVSGLEGKKAFLGEISLIGLMIITGMLSGMVSSIVGTTILGIVSMYMFIQWILLLFIG